MRARFVALPLALLLTGASDRDPLEGLVAGTPVDCVNLSSISGPQIVDETTILYRESGRRTWRTGPVGSCPALRPITTLIVQVYGGRLCRNDRFQVLDPGLSIPSGFCRFTQFTPYDNPPE